MKAYSEYSTSVMEPVRVGVWFFLILAVATVLRLVAFNGVIGADDGSIAEHALQVLQEGPYLPQGHYAARIGLIYPLAAIFAVAGVGEWQMVLIPFVASLLGVFLAYFIGSRLIGPRAGLLAAVLVAVFPLDVGSASLLFPDIPLGIALAGSIALALQVPTTRRPYTWALLAGLMWGYAWLIKVEAVFLGFVYLGFLWTYREHWRPILFIFVGSAAVVFAENLVYWLAGGEILHRLHAALSQGGGKFVSEFSQKSLWVFPRAWFLTFYQFGLHYYALFAALVWALVRRSPGLLGIWLWVVVYLLWLQFGGNPFKENYSPKSHLLRYCGMITVPMAVIIAAMLDDLWSRGKDKMAKAAIAVLIFAGLFFINFNTLSHERELATKRALDIAVEQNLFPLYLDRTSAAVASLYLPGRAHSGQLISLQQHDFRTRETKLLDPDEIDGYVLLNRKSMEYGWNRYRVDPVNVDDLGDRFKKIASIDNPGNWLAYKQVSLLITLVDLIPVATLQEKVGNTGRGLLEGEDVILLGPAGGR